jgi:hypothetical protein
VSVDIQELAGVEPRVFDHQQVWPSIKVRDDGVDFLHLNSSCARFSAEKKVLKSSRTLLVH